MRNVHRYVAVVATGALIAMLGIADNVAMASNYQAFPKGRVTMPPQYHGTSSALTESVRAANQRDTGCSG